MKQAFPCTRYWRRGWLGAVGGLSVVAALAGAGPPADAPPPDLDRLLRRAVQQAQRDREVEAQFKARYAYVRTRITDTLNAEGELKRREHQRFEHTPEHPEPDSWAAKGDDRSRAYERRDVSVAPHLLARFRFTLTGHQTLAERPAWVVDFEPVSDRLPADSLIEKFINRMAGRLWIDAADEVVCRAEFQLTGPVNVVGGLVGALREVHVSFARERTAEGLWFTRWLAWRIEGRKFFSRRIMTHVEEITQVRRADAPAPATPVTAGAETAPAPAE